MIATAASWSKENGTCAVNDHHWDPRSQHVAETSEEWIILNSTLWNWINSCWVVIVGFVDFVVLLVSGNTELFRVCFSIVNNCKLFVALFCTKEVLFFGPICR